MIYKKLHTIPEEMIKNFLENLISDSEVISMERDKKYNHIDVKLKTNGWGEGKKKKSYTDTITLDTDTMHFYDFECTGEEQYKWQQFLIAKGYHPIWENNQYV